ncbi:ral guanine nucleotide dissociation stimulator-like 1 [Saccoglossus kowalevskii]|uniref:Ral guanine nucleotide dissociation stimulator-like 1-like n=1 Tax=Saccoglossus kowalevskii TaxID=10224 RepID=A0ABM0M590_SACKO|nr:PREDICTED: ral guanine nucleotide dissociation stimulator-like 1-like [Saccoglossus kowalevskii]
MREAMEHSLKPYKTLLRKFEGMSPIFSRKQKNRQPLKTKSTNTRGTDNPHLWGEEIKDGVVYNVYLRKVKYFNSVTAPPSNTTRNPISRTNTDPQLLSYSTTASLSGEEYSGIQWETRREYVIKSATLERLVEELTQAMNHMDSSFINIFLNTYQSFTSTEKILNLLIQRYTLASDRHSGSKSRSMKKGTKLLIRKSVQSVLTMWLDENPSDFREPPNYPCLTTLMEFAKNTMLNKELTERCRRKIERWKNEDEITDSDSVCSGSSMNSSADSQFTFSIVEEVDNMMNPREFHQMEEDYIAEQLTYMDATLFRQVVIPHCLGTLWSKRDKEDSIASTVKATVEQFNKVSYLVISTILGDPTLKASLRAKIITKWIHIAQECRNLKNFSSLKAILSGLQANCIHRLRRTWTAVPKDSVVIFEELSEIFSHENNHEAWREILMKEGTAKFVDKSSTIRSRTMRRKSLKKELSSIVHGTIPYLGTFLTDLMMIHSAYPDDILQNGYINFEKKRKEFELLAQIRLLQKAAQNYHIHSDKDFQKWMDGVKIYTDEQSYHLSCIIEPLSPKTPSHKKSQFSFGGTWRRRSAIFHWSSSGSSTSSEDGVSVSSSDSPAPGLMRMSRSSSCSSLSIELSSISSSSSLTPLSPRYLSPTSCAIKVSMENNSDQGNIYKSILVNHEEHTPAVIATALCKYQKDEEPISSYELVQLLPDDEEMVIPDKCNVFYAINQSAPDLTFELRKKQSPSEKRPVLKKRNSRIKLLIKKKSSTS